MGDQSESGQSSGPDELLLDVRRWLDRNGYGLEMTAAQSIMRHNPLDVDQGGQYVDVVSGRLRETDVTAVWASVDKEECWHNLNIVVECKHTTSPWILFLADPRQEEGNLLLEDGLVTSCSRCDSIAGNVGDWMESWAPRAYAVTEKHNPDKANRERLSRDLARDGALSVVSASTASLATARKHQQQEASQWPGKHRMDVIVPVLVTTSPLITCRLGSRGELELERVDRGRLSALHETWDEEAAVLLATEQSFDALVQELVSRYWRGVDVLPHKYQDAGQGLSGAVMPLPGAP